MRLFICALFALALGIVAATGQVASGDSAWIARLEDNRQTLVISDTASGTEVHRRAIVSRDGVATGATALIALPARKSFLLALGPAPELWEIALFPDAGPYHDGFVHSYESGMVESLSAEEGLFARRRIFLDAPVVDLAPIPGKRHSVTGTRGDGTRVVISLAAKREVAVLAPE